jgi:hypothetical protein
MEAKDIEERGKQLAKAASGGDPPATLLALLDGLKGWTATEKLLRQTKIGVHVNKLRQNTDQQVARTAATLVNKWKTDVKRTPATAASSGTNSPAPAAKSSPAPAASKPKSEPHGDPEKRNSVSDKTDCGVTGNQTRDACIKLMYDGLAFMSPDGTYLPPPVHCLDPTKLTNTFRSLTRYSSRCPLRRACCLQCIPTRGKSRIPPAHTLPLSESQKQGQPKAP